MQVIMTRKVVSKWQSVFYIEFSTAFLAFRRHVQTKNIVKNNVFAPMSSLRRRANARNVSFRISVRWTIHIISPVDKTKLCSETTLTELLLKSLLLKYLCLGTLVPSLYGFRSHEWLGKAKSPTVVNGISP